MEAIPGDASSADSGRCMDPHIDAMAPILVYRVLLHDKSKAVSVLGKTVNTIENIVFDGIPRQSNGLLTERYEDPVAAVIATGVARQRGGRPVSNAKPVATVVSGDVARELSGSAVGDDDTTPIINTFAI